MIADVEENSSDYLQSKILYENCKILINQTTKDRRDLSKLDAKIATVNFKLSLYHEVLNFLNSSLTIQIELYGISDPEISFSYLIKGRTYLSLGKLKEAEEFIMKSHTMILNERVDISRSHSLSYLGSYYSSISKYDIALKYYEESIYLKKKISKIETLSLSESYLGLSNLYKKQSNYEKSFELIFKSILIRKNVLGENNLYTQQALRSLASNYNFLSQSKKCLEILKKIEKKYEFLISINHLEMGSLFLEMGNTYCILKNYKYSENYLKKSMDIVSSNLGENCLLFSNVCISMGFVKGALEEYEEAIKFLNTTLNIQLLIIGENNVEVMKSYFNIGNIKMKQEKYENAIEFFKKCLNIMDEVISFDNYMIFDGIANANFKLLKYDHALLWWNRAYKEFSIKRREKDYSLYFQESINLTKKKLKQKLDEDNCHKKNK